MVKVRKFKGFLADRDNASKIISPPYDTLNTEEAKEMATGNQMCFLRVSKPEIDLPAGTNLYDDSVYQKGRDNLMEFRNQGWIKQDDEERMYIYMQKMGDREQYGIMALASVEDYEKGLIKRHELTIKKKEEDRTRLAATQNANLGPVFLAFRDAEEIEKRMMEIVVQTDSFQHVVGHDGVEHVLWLCSPADSDYFAEQFAKVPAMYIADGHHRAASAYNVGKMRKEEVQKNGGEITGDESFMYFMAIHYPESNLKIMDYNRVLKTLNELTPDQFLEKVSEVYDVSGPIKEDESPKPQEKGQCSLYLNKQWYKLKVKDDKVDKSNLIKQLDSQILTDLVLTPVLGISDLRTDERIDFVGGIRGLKELEKRCNEDCVAAFAMYPVQMKELFDIADAGLIMPPKSTWFEPKPRDGYVCCCFD